jgi:hypothetical protein
MSIGQKATRVAKHPAEGRDLSSAFDSFLFFCVRFLTLQCQIELPSVNIFGLYGLFFDFFRFSMRGLVSKRIIKWTVVPGKPLYHSAEERREISRKNIELSQYRDQLDRLLPLLDRAYVVARWVPCCSILVAICYYCRGEIDIHGEI